MAYNNLQRHYSVNQGHTYIDGVPFKVTDSFKPPPEVKLPVGFSLPSQTASLVCTYDFRLEEQVIQWANAVEKMKQEEQEEAANRQQQTGQRKRSGSTSSLEEDSPSKHAAPVTSVGGAQPPLNFNSDSTSILTPIKASNASSGALSAAVNGSGNSAPIDYTLFESASDPFDSLELKTIDDLAELKNVLQPQAALNNSNNTAVGAVNHSPVPGVEHLTLNANSNSVSFSKGKSSPPTANSLAGALGRPVPAARKSKLPPLPATKSLTGKVSKKPPRPAMPLSKSAAKPLEEPPPRPPSYDSLVNGTNGLAIDPARNAQTPKTDRNVYSRYGDETGSPRNGLAPLNDPPPYSEEPIPMYGSSPSFLNCGGIAGMADISHHPARRSSTEQFDSESWNRYTPLPPTPTMNSPTRPSPYDHLSKEQQEYVEGMTGMGFPQNCAVRLVEKFGAEQKVLDVLCLINQISERGYKKDDIETGLLLLDCDEEKTIKFLEAQGQLRNMGFVDDKINEALVQSELDVDKALDQLTA